MALGIVITPGGRGKMPPPPKPGQNDDDEDEQDNGGKMPPPEPPAAKEDGPPKPPAAEKQPPSPDQAPKGGDDLAQCHEDVQMIYQNAPAVGAALCKFIASLCRDEAGEAQQSPDDQGAGAPLMGGDQA